MTTFKNILKFSLIMFFCNSIFCLAPKANKALTLSSGLSKSFSSLYEEIDVVKEEYSHDNILELVKRLNNQFPTLVNNSEVLILFRFNPEIKHDLLLQLEKGNVQGMVSYPLIDNLVALDLREKGATDYHFHVVFRNSGKIYDLSLAENNDGIPEEEYFDKMFLYGKGIENFKNDDLSDPMRDRKVEKLNRYRFESRSQMLSELRVRPISVKNYLEFYYKRLDTELKGNYKSLWLGEEKKHPSFVLGRFLADQNNYYQNLSLPDYETWDKHLNIVNENKIPPYVEYEDGIKAYTHPDNLLLGELQQISKAISLVAPYFKFPQSFNRTDRDLKQLQKIFFPSSMLNINDLKNKIVIDMSAGGGLAVEEMRIKGINAFGVELALSQRQRKMMIHDTTLKSKSRNNKVILKKGKTDKFFIQAHAAATGIEDNQVDIIYETYGVFNYMFFYPDKGIQNYLISVVNEWKRILAIGGIIRISNIDSSYEQKFRAYFDKFSGLRFVRFEIANPKNNSFRGAIEIMKIEEQEKTIGIINPSA